MSKYLILFISIILLVNISYSYSLNKDNKKFNKNKKHEFNENLIGDFPILEFKRKNSYLPS